MRLSGSAKAIMGQLQRGYPEADKAVALPPEVKRQLLDYQLHVLHILASACDYTGAEFLEIGTGHGGSGFVLAHAAPHAHILSLTTSKNEAASAMLFWRKHGLRNITTRIVKSWDLLKQAAELPEFDFVFVDGDHNAFGLDLPWFNRVKAGGIFLCHDYSPKGCRVASPVVYAGLNLMASKLGRDFDVLVIDDEQIGMAGFCRGEDEFV